MALTAKDKEHLVNLGVLLGSMLFEHLTKESVNQPKLKTISNRKYYTEKAKAVARKITSK